MSDRIERPCEYCQLPVAVLRRSASELADDCPEASPVFCCYGCRIASSIVGASGQDGALPWQLVRLGLALFFSMNVMVIALALWSWNVYEHADLQSERSQLLMELLRHTSLLLASVVLILLLPPLLDNVTQQSREGRLSIDLLIVAGVLAAFFYSVHSVLTGGRHTYFETSCMVLVSVTFGRWLEAEGKRKTTASLRALERLLPDTVHRVVRSEHGAAWLQEAAMPLFAEETPRSELQVGDWIRVRPGERIAVDGVILRGQAAIDQRIVSGEATPAVKEVGDAVYAGSLNHDGDLLVEARSAPEAGAISRIVEAVTHATALKGRLQTQADRVASYFVPCVAVIAVAVFLSHLGADWSSGLFPALSVVLIACPCALGIATPLAVWTAIGRAAEGGVLCADADTLQRLATAKTICFDKTGTLTTGQAVLSQLITEGIDDDEQVLIAALAAANSSNHPLAKSIREYAEGRFAEGDLPQADDVRELSGRGVMVRLAAPWRRVALGSERMMNELQWTMSPTLRQAAADIAARGQGLACIGWNGDVRGVFAFDEEIRPEANAALGSLRDDGWQVLVLTGDHRGRGDQLARQLGVEVRAELLPEEKVHEVSRLRRQTGSVVMVGDGLNDAPALAAADVGVAMGCGADVTREAAGVCLLSNDLSRIRWAVLVARQAMRTVRQNLFWAFAYNTVGIVLAAVGWLNPILAAVAMVGSSLFVIGNSLKSGAAISTPTGAAHVQPQAQPQAVELL